MNIEKPSRCASDSDLPQGVTKIDALERAFTELFFIEHPSVHKSAPEAAGAAVYAKDRAASDAGIWIHYPWLNTAIRIPSEATYFRLRTTRNRNLITENEQQKYRNAAVGVAGLSVGSAAVSALVATGGPKILKIADPDMIEITNLNRIRASLADIGLNKTEVAAREAWELDPFLELELWRDGVTSDSLEQFMGEPSLGVYIDEMDSIPLKLESRVVARRHRIPVVMATDNGDSIIVDVERFDLEPERPIFHGRVHIEARELAHMDRATFIKLANEIIDPALFTLRQQASIMAIGKELAGIPQLGTAATIAGAAIAYVVRQILIGAPMQSGRYVMGCEMTFTEGYESESSRQERAAHTQKFIDAFRG